MQKRHRAWVSVIMGGFIYLVILAIAGYITNKVITIISMNKSYKIKDIKIPEDK